MVKKREVFPRSGNVEAAEEVSSRCQLERCRLCLSVGFGTVKTAEVSPLMCLSV